MKRTAMRNAYETHSGTRSAAQTATLCESKCQTLTLTLNRTLDPDRTLSYESMIDPFNSNCAPLSVPKQHSAPRARAHARGRR